MQKILTKLAVFVFLFYSAICRAAVDDQALWRQSADLQEGLAGMWRVSGVRVSAGISLAPSYKWNDPRLLGRFFTLSREKIENDTPEREQCSQPRILFRKMNLKTLLQATLPMAEGTDIASAYELPKSVGKDVEVGWISCSNSTFGPDLNDPDDEKKLPPRATAWLLNLSDNEKDTEKLALLWYDWTILILDRVPTDAKPDPSFHCAQARSQTEHAICASLPLASFDRSVSEAYKMAENNCDSDSICRKKRHKQQTAWINKRDKCGADTQCLISTMQDRVEQLMELSVSPE